jgi:tetratricopeptide (TPR) repeat protein
VEGESALESTIKILKGASALSLLVKREGSNNVGRAWGSFDSLGVRAIDDLSLPASGSKRLILFTEAPAHSAAEVAVAIPAQIALERAFFHLQCIDEVVFNPRLPVEGTSLVQSSLDYSLPASAPEQVVVRRSELPYIIGALELSDDGRGFSVKRATALLNRHVLFSALYAAHIIRTRTGDRDAWFIELFAMSFLGLPEEALRLYEEYPHRGAADPDAQLLAARFRLLLKQSNEARTILHTLTFNDRFGSQAQCELARSFVAEEDYGRALDSAVGALAKDAKNLEATLIRALAERGISYPSGDEVGLRDALKLLEVVATEGGFNSPEALFHAGVIFARLGALEEAETTFRQSLFQRDRFASRDALIRVLCSRGARAAASAELEALHAIRPDLAASVSQVVAELVEQQGREPDKSESGKGICTAVGEIRADDSAQARALLQSWNVPIQSTCDDFATLDEFINMFAPAGRFAESLPFSFLNDIGVESFARSLALHLGRILCDAQVADWAEKSSEVGVVIRSSQLHIPVEVFVRDRLMLGAGGDNLSELQAITADLPESLMPSVGQAWVADWQFSDATELERLAEEGRWVRARLEALGTPLSGGLQDISQIDLFVDKYFDPGGSLKDGVSAIPDEDVQRLVDGFGILVGILVSTVLPVRWFQHPEPEGVSFLAESLGRVFPVARAQRRVYLADGADYGTRLQSFELSVAAAVVLREIKNGVVSGADNIAQRLKEISTAVNEFSGPELTAFADALIRRI